MRIQKLVRIQRFFTVTTATLVLVLATTHTADAQPGGTTDTKPGNSTTDAKSSTNIQGVDQATLDRQAKLDKLADLITSTTGTESQHTGGYAGIVVKPETGTLSVYWNGPVPPHVRDVQAKAAATGLTVTLTAASYSAQQLETARIRLERATEDKRAADVPAAAWNAIAVEPDGSGLSVTYNSSTATPSVAPGARAMAVPASRVTNASPETFAASAQAVAGVPVRAAAAPESAPTFGRNDDYSPYWGGAQLHAPLGFCSTGFGGRYAGSDVVLTASHCGTSGSFYTGSWKFLGSPNGSDTGYDVTFVRIANGSAGSNYYDGAWNDPTGYNKHIQVWSLNRVGDYVCTSGAMSGIHCGIKVKYAGVDATIGGVTRHNVVQGLRTNGNDFATANGDSGGPVVACNGSCEQMQARGIISGAYGQWVVCPTFGVGTYGPTTCYEGVSYIGMSAYINNLGFVLYGG